MWLFPPGVTVSLNAIEIRVMLRVTRTRFVRPCGKRAACCQLRGDEDTAETFSYNVAFFSCNVDRTACGDIVHAFGMATVRWTQKREAMSSCDVVRWCISIAAWCGGTRPE